MTPLMNLQRADTYLTVHVVVQVLSLSLSLSAYGRPANLLQQKKSKNTKTAKNFIEFFVLFWRNVWIDSQRNVIYKTFLYLNNVIFSAVRISIA